VAERLIGEKPDSGAAEAGVRFLEWIVPAQWR
jgi:hypothetical protein